MRTDSDVKRNVEDELRYDPDVDSTDIGVSVKSGVVTLTGFVRSYSQKLQPGSGGRRVSGVLAGANDIEVRLPGRGARWKCERAPDGNAQLKLWLPFSYE